ncbi:MAG: hypothetical protein ACFFE5_14420, partial [Candidatus Thorarchaeota archaeon]
MGDINPMVFEEYFDRLTGQRSSPRSTSNQIMVSKNDFEKLKRKADKYEALVAIGDPKLRCDVIKELPSLLTEIDISNPKYQNVKV